MPASAVLLLALAVPFLPEMADSATPREDIIVQVRPRVVHCGSRVRLQVRTLAATRGDASILWEVERGLLLSDDLVEVEWRAPRKPGNCPVRVTVSSGGAEVRKSLVVDVRQPSTEGMVWIPSGPFLRGDTLNTTNTREVKTIQNSGDEPAHEVRLDGFWIDKHLVTNLEYKKFLDESYRQGLVKVNRLAVMGIFDGAEVPFYYLDSPEKLFPEHFGSHNARKPHLLHWITPDGSGFRIAPGKEKYPAVDVSWFGAAAYAEFHGKALPTEAQWEKAARGTDGRRFPWGDNVPTALHVNLDAKIGKGPTPVGHFSPIGDSPYGVADMVSGCFEWTNDWFNPDYYADNAGDQPIANPRGTFWGRAHAIRGFPSVLISPKSSLERIEPVSTRYSWHFEFFMGDAFANSETGFRTVLEPHRDKP